MSARLLYDFSDLDSVREIEVRLDPEEVWRCLGPAGAARQSLLGEVERAADLASRISRPMAISRDVEVESANRGVVRFRGGMSVRGSHLTHLFDGAEGAVFLIATAGPGVETEASAMTARGDDIEAVVLDAGGSAVALNAARQATATLTWELQERGYEVGPSIAPGTGAWDLTGQRTVFGIVPGGDIGVTLLDSLLMYPQKSQSSLIPFGRELKIVNDPGQSPCRTCRARRCPMRQEEYAGPPGA